MRVVFRADSSVKIGTGHLKRCLTLARALNAAGWECFFVCRELPGHIADTVCQLGHTLKMLRKPRGNATHHNFISENYSDWLGVSWFEDAKETTQVLKCVSPDLLVLDHYGLDVNWETFIQNTVQNLVVIDDLANRSHQCQLFVDPNLGRRSSHYASLLPINCKKLIGEDFAILGAEFRKFRDESLMRRLENKLSRILVSMGGIDNLNLTSQVIETLSQSSLPQTVKIDVILGRASPFSNEVRRVASNSPFEIKLSVDVDNMAQMMSLSDMSIGAVGGTAWERLCLGLPSIAVIQAVNQEFNAKSLERAGVAKTLHYEEIRHRLPQEVEFLMVHENLKTMSARASGIIDGRGTNRVIEAIKNLMQG